MESIHHTFYVKICEFNFICKLLVDNANNTNNVIRPLEFLECQEPFDHKGNETARKEAGHGCSKVEVNYI